MSIYITKDGKKKKLNISATDVQVLDIEDKFKKKNLESVINELSDTEHIYIGEVDSSKDGIWIDDGEILDNSKNNGVVERLKTFVNETIGELSSLTTSIKSNIVGAINELKGNVDQLSNSNLLINGDFQVWQRGTHFENVLVSKYQADRWQVVSTDGRYPAVVDAVPDGLKITQDANNASCVLRYFFEESDYKKLKDKTLTCSFSRDGVISVFHPTITVSGSYYWLEIGVGKNLTVNWVKLELGSKATPFVPRSYGEELALCQRYYRNYDVDLVASNFYGIAQDTTALSITLNFDTPMRITPHFTLKNNHIRRNSTGDILTLSSFSKNISPYGLATMYLIKANIPLVPGQPYSLAGTFDSEIY